MLAEINPVIEDISINEACKIMNLNNTDELIIIDEGNKVIGMLYSNKINSIENRDLKIKDFYNRDFFWTKGEESILDLLKLIEDNDINKYLY